MSYDGKAERRAARLRALKAYGLRAAGLKLREIAPRIGRRDKGSANWQYRDYPVSNEVVRMHVYRGAKIVARFLGFRNRAIPECVKQCLTPKSKPSVNATASINR